MLNLDGEDKWHSVQEDTTKKGGEKMNAWFSFNGVNFSKWLKLVDDNRASLPPRKFTNTEVHHGVHASNKRWGEYLIELDVLMISTSYEEQRKAMREMAYYLSAEEGKLVFFDEPDKAYHAFVVDFSDFTGKGLLKTGKLVFQVSDPVAEGAKKELDFTGSIVVNYTATAPAMPVYSIFFHEDAENVQIEKDGKRFKLNRVFHSGDQVVIDSEKSAIRYNDEWAMPLLDLRSGFKDLFLHPGENHIAIRPETATVEIAYKEKWL
ncbi:hypothetical protein CHH74_16970 [Shouchella clausii]|nr:hypothetical protein CHH74_16970 [Shouchella clausii]PTL21933.1 phage tail family protein [Shouchella clausii]